MLLDQTALEVLGRPLVGTQADRDKAARNRAYYEAHAAELRKKRRDRYYAAKKPVKEGA